MFKGVQQKKALSKFRNISRRERALSKVAITCRCSDNKGEGAMTLIVEYVNGTVFKEICKLHPASKIQIDHVFPESASLLVPLVPGKLCFKAQVDLCEKPELMKEITALSVVTDTIKESK
jgi:hypothetical protein